MDVAPPFSRRDGDKTKFAASVAPLVKVIFFGWVQRPEAKIRRDSSSIALADRPS